MLKMSSQENNQEAMGVIIKIEDDVIDEKVTLTNNETNQSTSTQLVADPLSDIAHKPSLPTKRKLSNEDQAAGPVAKMKKKKKKNKKNNCQRQAWYRRRTEGLLNAGPSSVPGNNYAISSNNSSMSVGNPTKTNNLLAPKNNSSVILNKTSLVVDTTQVTINKVQLAVNSTTNSTPARQHYPDGISGSIEMEHTSESVSSSMNNCPVQTQRVPICVGILANPPRPLTESDVTRIKKLVKYKILENVGLEGGFAPRFAGKPKIFDGVLNVLCQDIETYNWLCCTIPNLPVLEAGRNLFVRPISGMPGYVKAGLFLQDCQDELEEVQQILSHCNPWAQVNSWFLVKVDNRKGKMFLTLNIPFKVVPILLEKDRRLSYLLGSVYISFFGPKGKLGNTPPADKMKEIEKYLNRKRNQNKDPNFQNCRSSEQITPNNTGCDDDQQNSTNSDGRNQSSSRYVSRDRSPFGHRSNRNTERRPRSRDRRHQRSPENNRHEYNRRAYESRYKSNERDGDKRSQSRHAYEGCDRYERGRQDSRDYSDRREKRPHETRRASRDRSPRYENDYQSGQNTPNEVLHESSDNDDNDFQMPSTHGGDRAESHGYEQWSNYDIDKHIASSNDRNRPEGSVWMSSNNRVYQDKS